MSHNKDGRSIYAVMKTMCPSGYPHNGFVATHALDHIMWGHIFLVAMNQKVVNKLNKQCNLNGQKSFTTHAVLKSRKSKMGVIYMQSQKQCVPLVTTSCFVATHTLGHMMYDCTLLVVINQRLLNKRGMEQISVVISDLWHIEFSNLTKARWT